MFLGNLLLGEKHELHNRELHISGHLDEQKVDIDREKVDFQNKNVDIESVLLQKGDDFSAKTIAHIHRIFERFGFDGIFGRSAVMEILGLKSSGASRLISNLLQADIIGRCLATGKENRDSEVDV